MSKALTASIVIGAALSASYNNVFKTAKQKQHELGKAFADTNKKLKASDAVVEYKHKLTTLKRKYAEAGGGNKRMAAGIADLERRYRAAKRELKSYGVAVGDAVKAQKRLAQESKKLSKALKSDARLERNKALRQELHAGALPVLGAAYGVGRILGGAMAVEQQEIRLQTVINADDGDARAAVRRAREHAINVARTSLASQSEILDIQYALNSAGLSEQASRVGSEIVSKVATVTYGMPEQVAEIIGTTFNNMGDAIAGANVDEKLGRIGDVLTKIQFKYQLRDFGQLGESMKEAASQASISKVGLEETAVALGLLNSAGLDGSKGGTAFSATLRQIKKAADELGFSIVRGADGQMDFVATLRNVNSALAAYDDIDERGQIIQDLFGDEGKKGLVPLLNNLDKFRRGLDEVRQSGGLVDDNYQLFKDSASGQTKMLKQNVPRTGRLGKFNPRINKVVSGAQEKVAATGLQDQAPRIIGFDVNGNITLKVAPISLRFNIPSPDIKLISGAQAGKIREEVGRVNLPRRDNPGIDKAHVRCQPFAGKK